MIWVWIAVGGIFTFIGWFWREVCKVIEEMEYDEEGWIDKRDRARARVAQRPG